ncbi:ABC transporter substrate-binding protein [Paenibacillus aceris]|uniref:Multiple sugar transport system substrate-binding protein n=1 Tax=Paenibacillus aceris TaxID=869555 RepID=A0ABS4HSF4_9BACL|nr:ABC transporter substrate-binding protein [Paenibacillus aceris]MBP1961542.1 multiple sugar transport system substrate-binding protein [Paenibacillus aceris]NHW37681.1 carbohydrate ABC transporter substrate-binding protein [Paenibacillus aceris]
MKRRLLPAMLLLPLLFTVIGCSTKFPSADGNLKTIETGTNGRNQEVKLCIAWWGGQARHDYTLKLIAMYQELNPNVKIDTEYAGFDDFWKKLAPQAAANQLPDIIQMDISYLTQYATKDQLEDLSQLTDNGTIDVSSASPETIDSGRVDGKLYGIPLGVNAMGTTFDDAMLKAAGISSIPQNWTWFDLEQIAKRMKEKGKVLDHMRFDQFFPYYLRTQNQHYFSQDGTSLGFSDPRYFIDYFTMYLKWYEAGYMRDWDKESLSKLTPEENPIALGDGFMTMAWSNQFSTLQEAAKKPLRLTSLPGPNGKQGLYLKPTMLFSIPKSSKQKTEAAKFISWFLNDLEANKLIKGDRGIPISKKVVEGLEPTLTTEEKKVYDYVAWAEKNSSPMDPPDPIGSAEVSKLLRDMQEQILFRKISVESAATKFMSEANAILAKNKK